MHTVLYGVAHCHVLYSRDKLIALHMCSSRGRMACLSIKWNIVQPSTVFLKNHTHLGLFIMLNRKNEVKILIPILFFKNVYAYIGENAPNINVHYLGKVES